MRKENRNAFELLAIASRILKAKGKSKEEVKKDLDLMTSGDYNYLVACFRSLTEWSK